MFILNLIKIHSRIMIVLSVQVRIRFPVSETSKVFLGSLCDRLIQLSAANAFPSSIRTCLQLITDCPPAIQEELDLISALGQLEDFSVKILPLQGNSLRRIFVCMSTF